MKQTLLLFFLIVKVATAQTFFLDIIPEDENTRNFLLSTTYKTTFLDSNNVYKTWNKIHNQLTTQGYYSYSHTSIFKNDSLKISLQTGQAYNLVKLNLDSINEVLLAQIGLNRNNANILTLPKTQVLMQQILSYYENNGFPFARLKVENVNFLNDTVFGKLYLNKGPFRLLDSIAVKSETKIPEGLIKYQLGLKSGQPYNEKKLLSLNSEIEKVPFLQQSKSPQVLFEKDKTTAFVYFNKQNANKISGIAGINTKEDGSVFFTGELDLSLYHIFKSAENININWQAPREGSQQLNANFSIPYLMKSPFGLLGNVYLYREDSTFSNQNFEIGLSFMPNSSLNIEGIYQTKSSTNLQGLSNIANFNTTYILLKTHYKTLNHPFLPTKGTHTKITLGQGNRESEGNHTTQYTAELIFKAFLSNKKKSGLYLSAQAAGIFNTPLVLNEVYRIGGVQSIRGFNEQSLFASSYAFSQIEYRYFLERFTYAFLFSDLGYLENTAAPTTLNSSLLGLGAGFSFYTKGGIFTLALAAGKQDQNPFDLRNIKVHLSFVNRF